MARAREGGGNTHILLATTVSYPSTHTTLVDYTTNVSAEDSVTRVNLTFKKNKFPEQKPDPFDGEESRRHRGPAWKSFVCDSILDLSE